MGSEMLVTSSGRLSAAVRSRTGGGGAAKRIGTRKPVRSAWSDGRDCSSFENHRRWAAGVVAGATVEPEKRETSVGVRGNLPVGGGSRGGSSGKGGEGCALRLVETGIAEAGYWRDGERRDCEKKHTRRRPPFMRELCAAEQKATSRVRPSTPD